LSPLGIVRCRGCGYDRLDTVGRARLGLHVRTGPPVTHVSPSVEDVDMLGDERPSEPFAQPRSVQFMPERPESPDLRVLPTTVPPGTPIPPLVGRTTEQEAEVEFLLKVARMHPDLWKVLVSMYFQEGRNPRAYLGRDQEGSQSPPGRMGRGPAQAGHPGRSSRYVPSTLLYPARVRR